MKKTGNCTVERDLDLPLDPVHDLPSSFSWALRDVSSEVWFEWLESTERHGLWAVDHLTNMY